MNDPFSLSGKLILVTGGTRGIGHAISIRFARAGALVIANFIRNVNAAEQLSKISKEEGLSIDLCRADLTLQDGLQQIEHTVESSKRPLSGLIHCAATGVHRPIGELTARHLDWTFSLNFRSFFELVKLLTPKFPKGASVVAVSSSGALRALPFYSAVGASKAALESLARHLAVEFAPRGVRVNILAPGTVVTDAWKSIPNGNERIAEAARRTPSGCLATLDDVACAAQFLISDAAAGVNGHTLVVDGGAAIVA